MFFSRKQRLFSRVTRFTDQDTLLRLAFSLVLAYVIGFLFSALVLHFVSFRFSLISFIFSIVLLTFPRLTWRSYYQIHNRKVGASNQSISTLVVGAGEGAHLFIKTIGEEKLPYRIVGIVDDDDVKKTRPIFVSTFLGAAICLIGNYFLIPEYAIIGAALSSAISYFIVMIYRLWIARQIANYSVDYIRFFLNIIVLSVFASLKLIALPLYSDLFVFVVLIIINYPFVMTLKGVVVKQLSLIKNKSKVQ
ncbi:polysaccharide biosynthesis C-terminal domain-containing protein [Streptococcus suis]|uniref:polysaccharide biosynthesis C-terminal domain-containing protein n=1 Tax=Streptococcus suis TaxID=1307 RepID=UPI000427A78E|nr:polysaccharide biosynthesis C-terminal domain-containing protein [Streptococcus suis]MBY4955483.1 polysaccharide biosynthesis C-terminal domain-containing protein [Streptococcus suis]MBY4970134.1 polysaccharide biosynthesis C-terminal domain-containing protein [Streptococcus suis]MBY5016613.1 polysaccharide biosynthesis C-terminal domain-containing protein [Streptococcus suis]MDG4507175.1 polysaccharide biosynthesis C-terminal domain-containing protein [Streptococcus suis]